MIGDETATNPIAQSTDNKVLNNIIVGVRRGFTTYGQSTGAGMKNYVIANNTIVLPASAPVYGNFAGMELHQHSGNNTGTVIKNNIVFSSAATAAFQPLMLLDNAAMTGVALDDNLYYAAGSASPFTTGVYPSQVSYGFSAWKAAIFSGGDANSIYSDPGFSGSASGFAAADYMLSSGSPAVNGGASLADIIGDFNNFTRSGLPDIGALENGSFYGLDVFPPLRPKSLRLK